jgi:hypothetical protein
LRVEPRALIVLVLVLVLGLAAAAAGCAQSPTGVMVTVTSNAPWAIDTLEITARFEGTSVTRQISRAIVFPASLLAELPEREMQVTFDVVALSRGQPVSSASAGPAAVEPRTIGMLTIALDGDLPGPPPTDAAAEDGAMDGGDVADGGPADQGPVDSGPEAAVAAPFCNVQSTVTTVAGNGTIDVLHTPSGVAVDTAGKVYVADTFHCRVAVAAANGAATTVAGSGTCGYMDGTLLGAQLDLPTDVAVDGAGNLYVADHYRLRHVDLQAGNVTTAAGDGTSATLDPFQIFFATGGSVYVAEQNNNRVSVVNQGAISLGAMVPRPAARRARLHVRGREHFGDDPAHRLRWDLLHPGGQRAGGLRRRHRRPVGKVQPAARCRRRRPLHPVRGRLGQPPHPKDRLLAVLVIPR